jgi:hypothetical protein
LSHQVAFPLKWMLSSPFRVVIVDLANIAIHLSRLQVAPDFLQLMAAR